MTASEIWVWVQECGVLIQTRNKVMVPIVTPNLFKIDTAENDLRLFKMAA